MTQGRPSRSGDGGRNRKAIGAVQRRVPAMGRRERRAAETRMRLFRCALHLFAERGFSNVTVEDITEAADVGKGTFFNYFETKNHVLGVMADLQLSRVREAAASASRGGESIQAVLHRLLLRLAEEPGRSPSLARALISSFMASKQVRTLMEARMREGRRIAAAIIAEGQARGEIDARLKKDKVAIQFLQMFLGTMLLWSLHEKPALTVWAEDSFQHFWRALTKSRREQEI